METYISHVTKVIDGDTIELETKKRIRLSRINAPEIKSDGGLSAKKYLQKLIENKLVEIYEKGNDSFGRTVADVLRKSDNLDISKALVDKGHATWIE